MPTKDERPIIGAIILAAGMSQRMGQAKLLLPLHGKLLFQHVLEVVHHHLIDQIVFITGFLTGEISDLIKTSEKVKVLHNPDYEAGMATSLKCGIRQIKDQVDATFIFLADQPFVPVQVIESIIEHYQTGQQEGTLIIRPSYQHVVGHPVLFDAQLFPEFNHIEGDEGGKNIIQRYHHALQIIPFANPIWGKDIDTPTDYHQMRKVTRSDLRAAIHPNS